MAVPSTPQRWSLSSPNSWWTEAQAGTVGSLSVLAVVLTLGLLAYSPLGASAAAVGLRATFITVVVGGMIYAAFGHAAMPAAGPSSATALILASLVVALLADPAIAGQPDPGVVVAGCGAALTLAGVLQVLLARLGLARLARLVPRPVLAGFMNGVALLILASQLPLLLGVLPGAATDLQTLRQMQPGALMLALGTVLLIVLLQRLRPRLPAALIALLLGAALYLLLQSVAPGVGLGPRLGGLTASWSDLLPLASWRDPVDRQLLADHAIDIGVTAVVLALIGGLESVLNLLAQDQQMDSRHDPAHELQVLGLCNLVCGPLGGLPVVMLRARAMAIVHAGGRSGLAAVVGSLALGLLYALGAPGLALLPLPVLGGIMVMVALGLVDRWTGHLMLRWWRGESSAELRSGLLVMAGVCGVTLWKGFAAGVALGILLSMAIFIARMNRSLLRSRLRGDVSPSRRVYPTAVEAKLQPLRAQIEVWDLEGALFFGNSDRLVGLGDSLPSEVRALVLDLRRVTSIDETGAVSLALLGRNLQRRGVMVQVAGLVEGSASDRALLAFTLDLPRQPDADRALEAAEHHLLGPVAETTLSARTLDNSSLLQGLDAVQVEAVRAVMSEIRLYAGQVLFRQGDVAEGLYVLSLGSVSVIGRSGSSTHRFLSISPGMMLGETAMLDGGGRTADAVADTFAVLHHLSQRDLQVLEREQPALASRLHANIAVHLSTRLRAASSAWWASQR